MINAWLIASALLGSNVAYVQQKNAVSSINEQTFLVYRRYYFVARLDKTIKILAKMYQEVNAMQDMLASKSINFDDILPVSTRDVFEHKQVRRSIDRIVQTRSLKPLFMVWDSFKSYKSLHDDLLVEDFSKEIFIITRNTINCLHDCNRITRPKHICMHNACEDFDLSQRLEAIALMTEHLANNCDDIIDKTAYRISDMGDLNMVIHTDEVAFRFYCLHRLERAMQYLLSLPAQHQVLIKDIRLLRLPIFFWQKRGNRKTLTQLWDDVTQYKYVDNEAFMHDFTTFILLLLNSRQKEVSNRTLSHADVIAIHQQVEQLPIEEILNAIDVIVSQVGGVVDHYQKSGLTFSRWIRQYWWAPPLVISSIIFKFVAFYYKKYHAS